MKLMSIIPSKNSIIMRTVRSLGELRPFCSLQANCMLNAHCKWQSANWVAIVNYLLSATVPHTPAGGPWPLNYLADDMQNLTLHVEYTMNVPSLFDGHLNGWLFVSSCGPYTSQWWSLSKTRIILTARCTSLACVSRTICQMQLNLRLP